MATAKTAKTDEEAPESEEKPLLHDDSHKLLPKVFWSMALIAVSATLITYNKYLIHPSRFPYPVMLVFLHMAGGSVLSTLLLLVAPRLFPALTDPDKKGHIDLHLVARVVPVGLAFVLSLVLSNTAYQYASIPFLQMIKQSNVIIVFMLSLLLGLEQFRTRLVVVLFGVMIATTLTIHGEMNFSLTGLIIQLLCNFAESSKVVMQGVLLSGALRLDPMSFVAVVSPLCGAFLGGLILLQPRVHALSWIVLPAAETFRRCGLLLAGNILCAFVLNLVIANYLKNGSPVAFILTNLVKDAGIVIVSSFTFGDNVSLQQACAFSAQLSLIALWSTMKANAATFDQHGFCKGVLYTLRGHPTP